MSAAAAAAGAAAGPAPLGRGPLGGEPEAPCIRSGQAGDLGAVVGRLQVVMLEQQVQVEGQQAERLQQEQQLLVQRLARRGGQPHEGGGLVQGLQHIWRSKASTYWNIEGTVCGGTWRERSTYHRKTGGETAKSQGAWYWKTEGED